jgi:hypothetical protein
MKKVYADPSLPYKQTTRFSEPTFNLCQGEYYGDYEEEEVEADEGFDGAFD